jgi:hypothetical protein
VEDGWAEIPDEYGETWDLEATGPLTGTYLGSREVPTTSPQGEERLSKAHDFETVDPINGSPMRATLWGAHNLDQKLSDELKGKEVQVAYVKTIPIQGGKQSLKLYRVLTRA